MVSPDKCVCVCAPHFSAAPPSQSVTFLGTSMSRFRTLTCDITSQVRPVIFMWIELSTSDAPSLSDYLTLCTHMLIPGLVSVVM